MTDSDTPILASQPNAFWWRFAEGVPGKPVVSAWDESHRHRAIAMFERPPHYIPQAPANPTAPAEGNRMAARFANSMLAVKAFPELDLAGNFTVELWARFGLARTENGYLIYKGMPGPGHWNLCHRTDGSVTATLGNAGEAAFFTRAGGGPVPGEWYHLAAVVTTQAGRSILRTYVNGNLRDAVEGDELCPTIGTDLLIGAGVEAVGQFWGDLAEVRITIGALEPKEFHCGAGIPACASFGKTSSAEMQAGSLHHNVPEAADLRKPFFIEPGTAIDEAMRREAAGRPIAAREPEHPYFFLATTGSPQRCHGLPEGYDPGFHWKLQGWTIANGGSPAGHHIAVRPGGRYIVALGFYDPEAKPGERVQHVALDGRRVDTFDPAAEGKPFVRIYETEDHNRDGWLQVTCTHAHDEVKYAGMINIIWVFKGYALADIDAEHLLKGCCPIAPIYNIRCGNEESLKGHVSYPPFTAEATSAMLPMRPISLDRISDLPQPLDPRDLEIHGELADRIRAYMDRWGFCGRDQLLAAGFLSDCGYEVTGRNIETYYMLGRLMNCDFELKGAFEALLSKQDHSSKYLGGFIGGKPLRTGFIWGQGTVMSGLMGYHEMTGDPRALEAAEKLAMFYRSYLENGDLGAANYIAAEDRFTRDGAIVGHLGKGALEPMVWLYWRTRDPQYLEIAKLMADLNRKWGSVHWFINGDDAVNERPELDGWHLHAGSTTMRGFPWLYAATGDRSYLDDAITACDRIFNEAAWPSGTVLEKVPWAHNPDPHDEICQTSDLLQLSFLLADFTGESRFYERGEHIYYNHMRFSQQHNGNFSAYGYLQGQKRGGDAWYCCGWWGGKTLYETARHLYASTPDSIYVTGYMPSSAKFSIAGAGVMLETEASIPESGDVRIVVTPECKSRFKIHLRLPSWAELREVRVNGKAWPDLPRERRSPICASSPYFPIDREWSAGDVIEINFDLPLHVKLHNAFNHEAPGLVSIDGAEPVAARYISVFRGPVIIAQFRVSHGNDLEWAYTGDYPELFESLATSADSFKTADFEFSAMGAPDITQVNTTPDGMAISWEWTPAPGWKLLRRALVHSDLPTRIDFSTELITPSAEAASAVKDAQFCGVRMRTAGSVDYCEPSLSANGRPIAYAEIAGKPFAESNLTMDNGFVQFKVASDGNHLSPRRTLDTMSVYILPEIDGNVLRASCRFKATGRCWLVQPLVKPIDDNGE